jgi:hypothetical protein
MSRRLLAICLLSFIPAWLVSEYSPSEPETISLSPRNAPYYEVDSESEADLVLVVDVSGSSERQATFNIKKNWRPSRERRSWFNIPRMYSACSADQGKITYCSSNSEGFQITEKGLFQISLYYSWSSVKGNGKFESTFTVPWRGEARVEKDGVKVHAYFRAPQLNKQEN